jgi:hypothetical protein
MFDKKVLEKYLDEMTFEEKYMFDNLMIQISKTLDVFERTGDRTGFVALSDQLIAFQREFE